MTYRKLNDIYCHFLIAAQKNFTATELSDRLDNTPAHDTFTRWLATDRLTPSSLWKISRPLVGTLGDLVVDDTVLDKSFGPNIGLSNWQYSGTEHRLVNGIGITTLLWCNSGTNQPEHVPVDYRIFDRPHDGKSKNDHTREMLRQAHSRGLTPDHVIFDSWYCANATLKLIDSYGWKFVTFLRANRKVNFVPHVYQSISDIHIPDIGVIVWLKGYGRVKVFKIARDIHPRIDYLVTNDVALSFPDIQSKAVRRWKIEEYHQGLKQTTGIESCQARNPRSQRNHIFCSLRTFLALETKHIETNLSWYQLKKQVISDAISFYLRHPTVSLPDFIT